MREKRRQRWWGAGTPPVLWTVYEVLDRIAGVSTLWTDLGALLDSPWIAIIALSPLLWMLYDVRANGWPWGGHDADGQYIAIPGVKGPVLVRPSRTGKMEPVCDKCGKTLRLYPTPQDGLFVLNCRGPAPQMARVVLGTHLFRHPVVVEDVDRFTEWQTSEGAVGV